MKPAFQTSAAKLALAGILFYTGYGLANFLASRRAFVPEIVFDWERGIPFWAWTIVPYWSLNLMYAAAFFLCRTTREQNRYLAQLAAAQIAAVGCFLLFPLRFSWPKPPSDGLFGVLFASLASFDQPYNQAPSLHIALTLIVGAFYWHRFPKIRLPLACWQSLIALSVLATYQHHFIDIPTGALLGTLVLWAWPYRGQSPFRRPDAAGRLRDRRIRERQLGGLYLIGAAAAALPALSGGAWLWTLWISAALLLCAFAYFSGNPAALQKQPSGKFSPAAAWLLLPYLIGVRLNMAFWLRGRARSTEISDGIHIGSLLDAPHFPAVLDLCAEYPARHRAAYLTLPLSDLVTPSESELVQAAETVESLRRQHGRVLVCCALGYGRSAAAALTWLTAYGGRTPEQAAALLQAARPQALIRPDAVQAAAAAAGRLKKAV
ncbi:phosphatase [Neisseria sp. KEM232]|uniref:phosphatase PAP2/dual specificity phosphatase family protein n=1 Tax=unclassified Neisseria TaxID=2623750 RepID=UPI000562BC5E|nr:MULTISPECIES: phosphatase PAP2/dual specificity phosphatase family protein [unclassified Neisseria]ASP18440.1 phosphatase [Neisseria sp. KEM232]